MDCDVVKNSNDSAIDAIYFTKAKYPKFMRKQTRISTYTSWMGAQRIEDMADAGFISLHQQDRVQCYCCGAIFRDWQPGIDPWIVHADHMPTCQHVLNIKGFEFVIKVVRAVAKKQAELNAAARVVTSAILTENIIHDKSPAELKDINDIIKELNQFKTERTCKVCMDAEINRLFVPCGHLACCSQCAKLLQKCPVCRANINSIICSFIA